MFWRRKSDPASDHAPSAATPSGSSERPGDRLPEPELRPGVDATGAERRNEREGDGEVGGARHESSCHRSIALQRGDLTRSGGVLAASFRGYWIMRRHHASRGAHALLAGRRQINAERLTSGGAFLEDKRQGLVDSRVLSRPHELL